MRRAIRLLICLLVFSLVINAGGIAMAKTYPSLHLLDQQMPDAPLKKPQRPQRGSLASSDPVGNTVDVGANKHREGARVCQYCSQWRMEALRLVQCPGYSPTSFPYSQYYPESLSPPPRSITSI